MDASFWTGKRAPGVPDTIDLSRYDSVVDVLEDTFKTYADRRAFTGINHSLTFHDIDAYSGAFAYYLQKHTPLNRGDAIALQMPNLLQYPIAAYGALRAGLRIVNTNPLYTEREMLHQFNDAGVRGLVCMNSFAKSVENVKDQTGIEHIVITEVGDMLPPLKRTIVNTAAQYVQRIVPAYSLPDAIHFRDALGLGLRQKFERTHLADPEDTIVLQYTGGTTGISKGAELTNRNLVANMLQADAMMYQLRDDGTPVMGEGQANVAAPLPLYHIYAFTVHLMMLFSRGDHSILIANPRNTSRFVSALEPWKLTSVVGLNTLFVSLLANRRFCAMDFRGMKTTCSGGTALAEDTARRWKEVTGVGVSEAYGLTECSPAVSMNPGAGLERTGSAGQALPNTALKCIDDEGNEVPLGERGELCVQGPQVMKGYWKLPDASREAFTTDGQWLKTGDVAIIEEDGFIRIVDRIKDLILVSGFNVYPNEIEDVVSSHPAVAHCAAIGVPNAKTGEAVKLFVVPQKGQEVSAEEIETWCRDRLTKYKVPKQIVMRDELPMSPVGKILRRELREQDAAEASETPSGHEGRP